MPTKSKHDRRKDNIGYAKRVAALQSPEVRKRISDGAKRWRAKQTPEERKEHNRKIARSYRRTVAAQLLEGDRIKYGARKAIIKWRDEV